jgi:hypothetical protein
MLFKMFLPLGTGSLSNNMNVIIKHGLVYSLDPFCLLHSVLTYPGAKQ